MMSQKLRMLTLLNEEFTRWEELLERLDEAQRTAPILPGGWSVKDVLAHLHGWQQVSIARLEAARLGGEPVLPGWLEGADPESEEDTDVFNARIYALSQSLPWAQVHREWRDGFLRFLELAEALSEDELLQPDRVPWLKGYPLYAVLEGLYEHHHEDHLAPLLIWLEEHRR